MQIGLFLSLFIKSITSPTRGLSLNFLSRFAKFSERFFVLKISLYASDRDKISLFGISFLLKPIKFNFSNSQCIKRKNTNGEQHCVQASCSNR